MCERLSRDVLAAAAAATVCERLSLPVQVSSELQGEGQFSSSAHYSSCGRSFSCLRSTRHVVDKYAPLVQYVAQAVCQLQGCERNDGSSSSSSSSGASGGDSSSSSSSSSSKISELDHLKLE